MNTTEKPDSPEYEINIESMKNTIAEMKQRSWNMGFKIGVIVTILLYSLILSIFF